jgi:hypothetical protein
MLHGRAFAGAEHHLDHDHLAVAKGALARVEPSPGHARGWGHKRVTWAAGSVNEANPSPCPFSA